MDARRGRPRVRADRERHRRHGAATRSTRLVFDFDLLIAARGGARRPPPPHGPPGNAALREVRRVFSFPVALAPVPQVPGRAAPRRRSGRRQLDGGRRPAARGASPSRGRRPSAPRLAAELYGLLILLAEDVEDLPATRRGSSPWPGRASPHRPATTAPASSASSSADRPGSLHGILGQFAARNINLTKLESRPDQAGPRRLLLRDRPRRPPGRRGGGGLPARPARRARPR